MIREFTGSALLILVLSNSVWAQYINRGNTFGGGPAGMGNAGGFATGAGMSNSTMNSQNFGGPAAAAFGYGATYQAPMQSIPGVSNFGGGYSSNYGVGAGLPGVGTGANMAFGMNGFVPGVAPPGFTGDMFGYDTAFGNGQSGFTDLGTAMTYSALGMGFGGTGYGPMGYGPMGYGPMGYGPLGVNGMTPGMVPGTFLPGAGYMTPADVAVAAAMNGVTPNPAQQPTRPGLTKPGATLSDDANATGQDNNAAGPRRTASRRSFLNDNVPVATANAIRIQNRLHHITTPNLKSVKVLIANRTAVLSGTVDAKADAELAARIVGLEPGVVDVKNQIVVNGEPAQ